MDEGTLVSIDQNLIFLMGDVHFVMDGFITLLKVGVPQFVRTWKELQSSVGKDRRRGREEMNFALVIDNIMGRWIDVCSTNCRIQHSPIKMSQNNQSCLSTIEYSNTP